MKILYAEDEKGIREAIAQILEIKGHEVTAVKNGVEAVQQATQHLFEMIVLDIMMPEKDGLTALKEMRDNQIFTPVILLTAKSQAEDVYNGFDYGADDYIIKPFEAQDLLARIDALHRRETQYGMRPITFGDVTVNKREGTISSPTISYTTDPIEIEIFRLLARMTSPISITELHEKTKIDIPALEFYAKCLQQKISMLNSSIKMRIKENTYQLVHRTAKTEK